MISELVVAVLAELSNHRKKPDTTNLDATVFGTLCVGGKFRGRASAVPSNQLSRYEPDTNS